MAIIKNGDYVIYQSFEESTGTTYELETTKEYGCRLVRIGLSDNNETKNFTLKTECSQEIKMILMKAYTNLSSEETIDFFERLSYKEYKKFSNEFKVYVGGQTREEYSAFVDDFGNLLAVTNYIYHYMHGCSSIDIEAAAENSLFMMKLRSFTRCLCENTKEYQNFILSLNEDTLSKYFEKSYVVK